MTVDSLATGLRMPASDASESRQDGLPPDTILSLCDRLLGEVGRRRHMFAWLRAPGSSLGDWLPVDAYYPRHRLVVMCRSNFAAHGSLYEGSVTTHGLKFLALDPADLGDDRETAAAALAAQLIDVEPVSRHGRSRARSRAGLHPTDPSETPPVPARRPVAVATPTNQPGPAAPPAERTARPTDDTRPPAITPPEWPAPAPEPARRRAAVRGSARAEREWSPVEHRRGPIRAGVEQVVGIVIGLALAAALIAELYLALITVAAGDGRPVLGIAIVLDAGSRLLGTVAAERAGRRLWACACAIGGAPIVACFTLLRRSGPVKVEPAPLAAVVSALAGLLALAAVVVGH